jgi:hypothetical protein
VVVDSVPSAEDLATLLATGPFTVQLFNDNGTVASVSSSTSGTPGPAASRQLDPGADDPASISAWCDSLDNSLAGPMKSSAGTHNHACATRFESSDLILSEIMVNGVNLPLGDDRWFELLNIGSPAVNLAGLDVKWGSSIEPVFPLDGFRINEPTFVNQDERSLVAVTTLNMGGRSALLRPSLAWPTEDGFLAVYAGTRELFRVVWGPGGISTEEGRSNELFDETTGTPDVPSGWCQSNSNYGIFFSAFGTPGRAPNCRVP